MQCRKDDDTIKKSCFNCNRSVHYTCMYAAKYIPALWINGNTPSKAVNQIFESINFRFICNDCLTDTVSDEHYARGDNSNCTNINNSDISNIETLLNKHSSDISDIKQLLEQSVLVKDSIVSYSDMLKKSTKSIDSIKTNIDIINKTNTSVSIYAAVIENVSNVDKNNKFICSLFGNIDLNTNTIDWVDYSKRSQLIIYFKSKFALNSFLTLRRVDRKYFTRPYLTKEVITHGKILYHVVKSKCVDNCKCVFNKRSSVYELRNIKNGKIDWNLTIDISNTQFNEWSDNYSIYVKSFNKLNTKANKSN